MEEIAARAIEAYRGAAVRIERLERRLGAREEELAELRDRLRSNGAPAPAPRPPATPAAADPLDAAVREQARKRSIRRIERRLDQLTPPTGR